MNKVVFFFCSDVIGGHEFQSIQLAKLMGNYRQISFCFNNNEQMEMFKKIWSATEHVDFVVARKPFFKKGNFILQLFYGVKNYFYQRELLNSNDAIICAGSLEASISSNIALFGKSKKVYVPAFVDRRVLWGNIGVLYNILSIAFIFLCKEIITINRIQARFFSKYVRTTIIPNKIDINIAVNHRIIRKKRLYYVGRLEYDKGILELCEWLDNQENPFEELIVVGSGSCYQKLMDFSSSTKHINIILTGWIDNSEQHRLINKEDVLVFNSLYEGEPLVIREANARGNITIVRDIIGVRACTQKSNRYKDRDELLSLLKKAWNGHLNVCANPSEKLIDDLRRNGAEKLFP
ncbi:glycosyltransferase [Pedobacter chitinilyticus]|uniref:Glycosyltransferase n=1 Tax=Pedobacter chitinilyticus TaxID=2233776 RepID=A0A443YNW8_9SPHI|nr:glycosyltransferase [Pedobacter chitinilyticus]RWU05463.1 glycosyltransferase [Pedobacter chitinilyticus]